MLVVLVHILSPAIMAQEDPVSSDTMELPFASKRVTTGKAVFSYARPNIFTAIVLPDHKMEVPSSDDSCLTEDDSANIEPPPLVWWHGSRVIDSSVQTVQTTPTAHTTKEVSTSTVACQVDMPMDQRDSSSKQAVKADLIRSFNTWSLLLGFVVGCFIQTSSLGANYILTVLFGHEAELLNAHRRQVYLLFKTVVPLQQLELFSMMKYAPVSIVLQRWSAEV